VGSVGQVYRAIQRLGMGLVATGATFWCPSPEMLAPLGLQDVIVTSSQAAALSDEQQLISVRRNTGSLNHFACRRSVY
jgi:hypothetical protein